MNSYIRKAIRFFCYKGLFNRFKDELYLKLLYWATFGEKLNLDIPKTYNEKLQWLKLHDRKMDYCGMVDKYEAKKFVADIIGSEYIIPNLGLWNNFDDIDFDKLPEQFVLKCTHDSGGLVICRDKNGFDTRAAKKRINKSLRVNYYNKCREWPYQYVEPRIIAEEYMEDANLGELRDYKFYTFNGVVEYLMVNSGRNKDETCADYFDKDFNHIDLIWGYPNSKEEILKPINFEKMKEFASILARETIQLRVDFYEVDGKLYFGELTFFDGSGFEKMQPERWNYIFGDLITLPTIVE